MLADEPELPLVGRDHAAHQQVAHDSSCLAKMVRAAARRSDEVDRTPRWRKSHMIRLPIAQSSARLSTWCAHMSPAPDVGPALDAEAHGRSELLLIGVDELLDGFFALAIRDQQQDVNAI